MINDNTFIEKYVLPILKTYNEDKKKLGYIPTLDLLIEELEEELSKNNKK